MPSSDYHRIMNAIRRSEKRIQAAHDSNEPFEEIEKLERDHIDKLKNMLVEPMSENIVEDNF